MRGTCACLQQSVLNLSKISLKAANKEIEAVDGHGSAQDVMSGSIVEYWPDVAIVQAKQTSDIKQAQQPFYFFFACFANVGDSPVVDKLSWETL